MFEEDNVNTLPNFKEDKVLNTLTNKVNDLIARYEDLLRENESLHTEIVTLKAQNEAKSNQIQRLENELHLKTSESDDIMKKIEAVLEK